MKKTNYYNATEHTLTPCLLSTVFFSGENIELLQNAIRAEIYKKSNKKHIIDKQNYDQLKIVMRAIYLQYALNQETHIKEQVDGLNNLVLDYCVPQVYNELMSYLKYKRDISTLSVPMQNPIHLSVDKTVELKHFF